MNNSLSIQVNIEQIESKEYCQVCKIESTVNEMFLFVGKSYEPIKTNIKYCVYCNQKV